jgi:hypothetical protein
VDEQAPHVDAFSLNRLILSENARTADAAISWADARSSINESARLARTLGYELLFSALPLCVFEGDNATYVSREVGRRPVESAAWELRYFDALVKTGQPDGGDVRARIALPDACLNCDYLDVCGRVEGWYVRRFGTAGLQPVRLRSGAKRTPAAHHL